MIEVTKVIEWDMAHRVPNHKSQCKNLHGHRYRMEVTVTGRLIDIEGDSSEGMVYDFSDLKKIMTEKVHDLLDHGCMAYYHDMLLHDFFKKNYDMKHVIVTFIPTAENIAKFCHELLSEDLPVGVKITNIRLFETPNSWADFKPVE